MDRDPSSPSSAATRRDLRRARVLIGIVALGLFISGITIWPAVAELRWLVGALGDPAPGTLLAEARGFVLAALRGIEETARDRPFLLYAHDWLAFAHIALAVLFLGAMPDPVRNVWVVRFGLVACAGVIPLALICGPLRGIPLWWRAIDCSFAVAAVPLLGALVLIRRIERRGIEGSTPGTT